MENSNIKKDPFGNTNMQRNWGMLASWKAKKKIWKSELLQTRGLKQFKASALDIQHGFNPQILTISITSSCPLLPLDTRRFIIEIDSTKTGPNTGDTKKNNHQNLMP